MYGFAKMLEHLEKATAHPKNVLVALKDQDLVNTLREISDEFRTQNVIDIFKNSANTQDEATSRRTLALAYIVQQAITQLEFFLGLADKESNHGYT